MPAKQTPPAPAPNPAFWRYAKAVVTFVVSAVGAVGAWAAVLPAGPIDRNGWIALAVAVATPFGAAFGVALTTNAE